MRGTIVPLLEEDCKEKAFQQHQALNLAETRAIAVSSAFLPLSSSLKYQFSSMVRTHLALLMLTCVCDTAPARHKHGSSGEHVSVTLLQHYISMGAVENK